MYNAENYLNRMIETRAYQLWEARGRPPGSGQEDWLSAEKEIRHHLSLASEDPATYLADAPEPSELPLF